MNIIRCIYILALSLIDLQTEYVIGYHDFAYPISFGKLK